MHASRLLLIAVGLAVFTNATFAQQAQPRPAPEWKPSADFKSGMKVGRALQAVGAVPVYIQLLSRMDDDETEQHHDRVDAYSGERAMLLNQLLHSAWLIHRAVELPDSVLPRKATLKKRLTMISDYLHENHTVLMDAKEYEAGRKQYLEELKRFVRNEEIRRLLREGYDWHIETVKILTKYRSTRKSEKADKE